MTPVFTPPMLQLLRLGRAVWLAPLPELVGAEALVGDAATGLERLRFLVLARVGEVEEIETTAVNAAVVLEKYDFADVTLRLAGDARGDRRPLRPMAVLREIGYLAPDPNAPQDGEDDLPDWHDDNLLDRVCFVHVFARVQRDAPLSTADRVSRLQRAGATGRFTALPAVLRVERAYLSNRRLAPWAFSYL
ncbi:MAG: hypothetical protein KC635_14585 [Myxococcales bacterium]|nr:hypothetical protein [Myxococcales bacterium]MCB9737040.1 hypothetical protein [Deltaproteobacteria bacterium]